MKPVEDLKQITPADLAQIGLHGVAYLRPVVVDQSPAFAIFAADGRQMGIVPSRDHALLLLQRNDLELATLH